MGDDEPHKADKPRKAYRRSAEKACGKQGEHADASHADTERCGAPVP